MTKQTETASAPVAQLSKEERAAQVKASKTFARKVTAAFIGNAKALAKVEGSLMDKVRDACAVLSPMNAATYDKTVRPFVAKAFDAKVDAGELSADTVPAHVSRTKVATLAILAGFAPNEGEGFKAFCARASEAFTGEGLKLPNGEPVWEGKKGRPAAAKGAAGEGKGAGASGAPTASPAAPSGDEKAVTGGNAFTRACFIAAKENKPRAALLAAMMSTPAHLARFDRFAACLRSRDLTEQLDRFFATIEAENTEAETAIAAAFKAAEAKAA